MILITEIRTKEERDNRKRSKYRLSEETNEKDKQPKQEA
jgi:hypothetical protein